MKKLVYIMVLVLAVGAIARDDRDIYPTVDREIFKEGAVAPAGLHNILSDIHFDSAVSAAGRGSLLVRDSSSKWARLSLGASGTILRSNGTDAAWLATTDITELGTIVTGTWNADTITVPYGGTGATTFTDGGILLGSGVGAVTAMGVAANGQIPIGDGATDPVLATLTEGLAIDVTNGAGSITLDFDPTELSGNRTWGDASTDTIVWTWDRATGTDPTMTFGDNLVTFNTVVTIEGLGTGGQTDYDLKVGDVDGSPTYGMIQIGNACIGRTSFKAGDMDIDGSVIYRNISGPVTSEIEHVFVESTGSTTRFALAKAGVGNATYNSRSMLIAGPAPADTNYVKVSYWQTANNIFHNLACDTSGVGADLGVQNDVEVEGTIFVDDINESTSGAGVTFNNSVKVVTGKNITLGSTQWNSSDEIDGTKIKDADYGDVDVSAGGAWTVSSVQPDSVTLGTDTTGNYVADVADGTGIDGTATGEGSTYTPTFDPTELDALTWSDGANASNLWTFDVSGTDPCMLAGSNLFTFYDNITVIDTITGGTITDGTATITSGDGTGFTSFVVDTITLDDVRIMTSGSMLIDTPIIDTGTGIQLLSDGLNFTAAHDDLVLVATNGDITLNAGTNIDIDATGLLTIDAAQIELTTALNLDVILTTSGTGEFIISGDMKQDSGDFDLNGSLDVSGTANLDVTDIDGTLNVQGNVVFQADLDVSGHTTVDRFTAVGDDGAAGVNGEGHSLTGGTGGTGTASEGGGPAGIVLLGGVKGGVRIGGRGGDVNLFGGTGGIGEDADGQGGDIHIETNTARGGGFGDGTFGDLYLLANGGNIRIGGAGVPTSLIDIDTTITGTVISINATGLAENAVAFTLNSNERGIQITTSDERCIFGNATTSGVGVQGSSGSGNGGDFFGVTGLASRHTIDSASANTTLDVMEVRRRTTDAGFGVNGIGGRICYRLENDSGSTQIAVGIDAVMTDVTTGSEVTKAVISVRDGLNGLEDVYTLQHNLLTVGNANATVSVEGIKFKITLIGGYAIKLTNKTGGNSVAGDIVIASAGTADAVDLAGANELDAIGVFLDSGIADGSEAWVVIAGIADVHMDAGGCALGDRIITSATAGRGDVNNAPAVATHFQEIGHTVEAAAANANARCVIHFL